MVDGLIDNGTGSIDRAIAAMTAVREGVGAVGFAGWHGSAATAARQRLNAIRAAIAQAESLAWHARALGMEQALRIPAGGLAEEILTWNRLLPTIPGVSDAR